MAGLSQHLFALGRANLGASWAYPTVRGIATGNLEPARFRAWLVQDYLFLLDYVRLFALAAARAPDTDTLGRLVDLAHATFHQELLLHRAYAAEFSLGEADLDRAEKSPGLRRLHRLSAAHRRDRRVRRGAGRAAALHVGLLRARPGSGRARPASRASLPALDPDLRRPRVRRPGRPGCAPCWDRAADGSRRPAWPPANKLDQPATSSPSLGW